MLRQWRYRGTIVTEAIFDAVQSRLDARGRPASEPNREYPLSGALRCGGCGRRPHGHASGATARRSLADGTERVYEYAAVRYYACVVCKYETNANELEKRFFEDVRALAADESLLRTWVDAPSTSVAERDAIERELRRVEAKTNERSARAQRDRLFDLVVSASLTDAEFTRQLRRLDHEYADNLRLARDLRAQLSIYNSHTRDLPNARSLVLKIQSIYSRANYAANVQPVRLSRMH